MQQIGLLIGSFFVSSAGIYYNGFLFDSVDYNPFTPLFSGVLLALVPGLLVALVCSKNPRDNIIDIANKLAGRFFGFVLVVPLVFIHFVVPLPIFRIAAELIMDVHLSNTPSGTLMMVLASVSCWIALLGTESVARTNDEHLVIIFPLTIILFILSVPDIRHELVQPLTQFDFSYWWRPEFYGSLMTFFGFSLVLFLNDTIGHSKTVYRTIVGLSVAGMVYLVVTVYLIIGTIGMEMASSFDQPLKLKMMTLSETVFIQRVDIFLILLWMFPTVTAMAGLIVTGARAVGQWLGMENYRPVIYAYFLIVVFTHSMFEMFKNARDFIIWIGPLWGGLLTGVTLILLVLSFLRKPGSPVNRQPRGEGDG